MSPVPNPVEFPFHPIVEFPIHPIEPAWSTNQDRKMNKFERHKYVQAWQTAVRQAWRAYVPVEVRQQLIGPELYAPPAVIQIEIPFNQKRRRDPHNYCGTVLKAVIDGLVNEGLWPDDTPEWVGHREPLTVTGNIGRVMIDFNK